MDIEITEKADDSPLTRVMFNFDGDYSAVVGNDEQGNTYLFYPFDLWMFELNSVGHVKMLIRIYSSL